MSSRKSSAAAGPSSSSSSSSSSTSKKRDRKNAPADRTTIISSTKPPSKADIPSTDAHLGLLVEHLTFNPRAFIDALVYVANEALYRLGEDFEPKVMQYLVDSGVDEGEAEREAEKATHSIITLLENALDHVFDTLELYSLQSVFGLTVRQATHIVLPHHAGLDLRSRPTTGSDEAANESTELSKRQRDLDKKISAARATSHALTLALQASERRLARVRGVHALAMTLLGPQAADIDEDEEEQEGRSKSAMATATTRLNHAVQVIKSHRQPLLSGIEKLRSLDPLGEALIHSTSTLGGGAMDQETEEEGKPGDEPWSAGREGYLRWQTERVLSSTRRSTSGGADAAGEEGSGDVTVDAKPSRSKRKSALQDDTSRRLSAPRGGRKSVPLHSSEGGMEGEEVGKTAEMEQLASLIQRRPAAAGAAAGSGEGDETAPGVVKGRASTSRKSRS